MENLAHGKWEVLIKVYNHGALGVFIRYIVVSL